MSEATPDIPYDRSFEGAPSQLVRLSPLVRRMVAPNPSPFTFTGTCTYVVGNGHVTVIDPGPDNAAHLEALRAALAGESVSHILVTHTHRDHSPGARALKAATGAALWGCGPHRAARALGVGEEGGLDAANDLDHAPDIVMGEGDTLAARGHTLRAVETPGHTMNHLAFALAEEDALFSGDHVMAWSTSIVAPPDGAMRPYMASLDKLRRREDAIYWPGHGGPVREPARFVKALAAHRRLRERAIAAKIEAGETTIAAIVARVYEGLDPRLRGAAALSVFAHLEDLIEQGRIAVDGPPTLTASYRPA